jgi:hypothetical protein
MLSGFSWSEKKPGRSPAPQADHPEGDAATVQDLARNADIEAIVRQKICGHATDEMSDLYSTVPQREVRRVVVGRWWGGP